MARGNKSVQAIEKTSFAASLSVSTMLAAIPARFLAVRLAEATPALAARVLAPMRDDPGWHSDGLFGRGGGIFAHCRACSIARAIAK